MKLLIAAILLSATLNASAQKPRKWTRLRGPNTGSYSQNTLMVGGKQEIIAQDTFGYFVSSNDGLTWDYQKVVSGYKAPTGSLYSPYSALVISQSGYYFFAYASARDDGGNIAIEGIYKSSDYG